MDASTTTVGPVSWICPLKLAIAAVVIDTRSPTFTVLLGR